MSHLFVKRESHEEVVSGECSSPDTLSKAPGTTSCRETAPSFIPRITA